MTKRWLGLLFFGVWLGGSGVAHAAFNPPPPLDFGNVTVTQSSTKSTTMTANGGTDVTVTVVLHGGNDCGEFQVVSPLVPVRVRGGMDQTVQIKFAPVSPGDKTCTVDINVGTNPFSSFVASGHAAAPGIDVTPAGLALSYGSIEVGATSATQTVTATNNGDATLTISSAGLSSGVSDYTVTGATSTTLAPTQSTNWLIACKPSTQDSRPGNFRILSDAFGIASVDVTLACAGTQGNLTTIPTTHDFAGVTVGSSVPFNFMLKNIGNLPVTNLTGALADTTKGYVFDTSTVPSSLAVGATANLTVTFTPTSGASGGAVNLNFSGRWGTNNTQTTAALGLNGDGQVASFTATPTPLAFGSFRFDTAPTLQYHIKNTGDVSISIDSVTFTPDAGTAANELNFTAVTAGTVLTPSQQIDVTVTALPNNRTGAIGGKVTVHSNTAGTSDQQVTITGTATAATFTATATTDFGAVDVGTTPSPTRTVTIQNGAGATLDINSIAAQSGSSTAFTYMTLPAMKTTLAPSAKLDITVTYHPTTVRAPGDFDTAVLVATLGGVLNGPQQAMMAIQGRGIDSMLTVQATPNFPATFRNPGSQAPVKPITVHNNGEATLKITQASVTGGPVWQLVDANPVDIPGGSSHDFMVRFSPTELGAAPSGQLILVQGGGRPNVTVTLNGTCMTRNIAFGPAPASPTDMPTINFPFTRTDLPVTVPDAIAIINQDPSVGFTIHGITIDANPAFTLLDAPADTPLPVGATQTVGVTFRPPTFDHFETVVHLYVDQDPTIQAEVRLVGDAVFGEAHGSGGCNAGGAGGGGLVFGLAALGMLRRRRRRQPVTGAVRLGLVAALVAAASLGLASGARADDIIGVGVFQPTPSTAGAGFALQAPEVGARGSLAVNGLTSYASNPLVFDWSRTSDDTQVARNALVARSVLFQLGIAYAALDRLEVGAHFPIFQQSGDAGPGGPPANGTAYGDLTLHAKARLLHVNLGLGTLGLGASAGVTLPTATKDQFVSTGRIGARLLALAAFAPAAMQQRLTLTVNAGSALRARSQYDTVAQQSGVAWGAGAQVRISDELWVSAEVFGEVTPSALQQKPVPGSTMPPAMTTLSQIEGLVGFTLKPLSSVAIGLAGGRGVNNALGTPDLRGVFSLSFVPGASAIPPIHVERPDSDADGDGILDSVDKCPNEPEDKDGFQDADGCPDPDNDADGIPDAADKCPLDPEDKDGFEDTDGCPDPDNDHDGIPDAMDKCPNDAEDKDGFEDLDGCPDPDNDHDGIPDEKDKCPNEPETINGLQDDDGCPDKGDSTIILSPDKIETLDPIQFTGVKLAKPSLTLLAQVGATLRAHAEIVRLRITVHVQPTRDADADQARSDKRAQAIRDWLIQWGIAPTRLEARGFGGIKPLVPPDQKGAARINDRLELIILERK